jgi:hypothetical protein
MISLSMCRVEQHSDPEFKAAKETDAEQRQRYQAFILTSPWATKSPSEAVNQCL